MCVFEQSISHVSSSTVMNVTFLSSLSITPYNPVLLHHVPIHVICVAVARCSLPYGPIRFATNAPYRTSLHSILLCKLVISVFLSQDSLVDAYL